MSDERVELRAERLRVLVAGIGEEPTMNTDDTLTYGPLPGGFAHYLAGLEYEHVAADFELACELANLGRELRARQWAALERLGALLARGEGTTPAAKFASLPPAEITEAARCMLDVWGHWPAAEEDFHGYVAPDEEG